MNSPPVAVRCRVRGEVTRLYPENLEFTQLLARLLDPEFHNK